jgi:hypothetical protein
MLRLEEADHARARSREEGGEEVVSRCPSLRGRRERGGEGGVNKFEGMGG